MKVYLSGPITGVPDFKEKFEAAEIEARKRIYDKKAEIFNPATIELPTGATHEDYMKIRMFELSKCDAVYLMNGWQNSRGACREYGYALGADMMILHQPKEEKDKTFAEHVMDKLKGVYEEDNL